MPPPRIRTRIRTLMILVAVVAVVLGWAVSIPARRARFYRLAVKHIETAGWPLAGGLASTEEGTQLALDEKTGLSRKRRQWHEDMAAKYYHASQRPWLPVLPDPPMPP